MASPSTGPAPGLRAFLGLIFLAIAALVMVVVYVSFPANDHVGALLGMGVVALVFALIAYFASSLTPASMTGSASWWGLAGLGFAFLFLTLGFAPAADLSAGSRILGAVLTLLALAVVVGSAYWMRQSKAAGALRAQERAQWAAKPPVNALDYPQGGATTSPATKGGPGA